MPRLCVTKVCSAWLLGTMAASVVCTPTPVLAVEPVTSQRIDQRFAAENQEVPDFRQHVVPLLGKLGCNGRACHGSFQGQGDFRLSLFGYDFKADHENLLAGEEPRTNLQQPADSLMLTKPLMVIPHEGGERLKVDTWQYRVLHQWITGGAKPVSQDTPEFVRMEITPSEIVAKKAGEEFVLKAIAIWSDGSQEDVTPLCRFQSNNDQIALVDETGKVTSVEPGDSHVVVFYDNGVVPVPVIQPVSSQSGEKYPAIATATEVDKLVVEKLKKLGVVPSEVCTDSEFLRRVSLDITGTLPTASEVQAFLSDTAPDKRSQKINELLERPGYAAWWATKMSDYTGANRGYINNVTMGQVIVAQDWYDWFRVRFEQNQPYDEIAKGVILATSRQEGESYEDYCKRMSDYYRKGSEVTYKDQPNLTHYWSRTNFRTPQERSLGFAYSFLGIRIQCAECHKHPFDQWTKDDFDRFTGFFDRIRYAADPSTRKESVALLENLGIDTSQRMNQAQLARTFAAKLSKADQDAIVPFLELYVLPPKKAVARKDKNNKKRQQVVSGRTAKILGGEEVSIDNMDDPREALMDWLLEEENPYFARAFVNRVWATYFHRGIVEPTDDLSLANPPSNEALLDYLSREFVAHDYDIKWLHREICNSATYQRSWKTNETNILDDRNFSHQLPRRLPAEIAYDAVRLATASDAESAKLVTDCTTRAIADTNVNSRANGRNSYALTVFGRSIRESNCDCDRSMEVSLLQTVFLQNDSEALAMIDRRGGWVDQIVRGGTSASDEKIVQQRKALDRQLAALRQKAKQARDNGNMKLAKQLRQEFYALETRMKRSSEESAAKDEAQSTPEAAEIINQAYLRTVSRFPTDEEQQKALAYLKATDDLRVGVRDLLWALLNTKEFVVNH